MVKVIGFVEAGAKGKVWKISTVFVCRSTTSMLRHTGVEVAIKHTWQAQAHRPQVDGRGTSGWQIHNQLAGRDMICWLAEK